MRETQLSGKGEIVSYTIVHDAPPAFMRQRPYVLALIKPESLSEKVKAMEKPLLISTISRLLYDPYRIEENEKKLKIGITEFKQIRKEIVAACALPHQS